MRDVLFAERVYLRFIETVNQGSSPYKLLNVLSNLSHIRPQVEELILRLGEPRQFIQVISGARQVGKTTMARQAAERSGLQYRYATADGPTLQASAWIEQQWQAGRILAHESDELGALLILDEIQKVPQWAESIKRLWDEDAMNGVNLKVVTLSSTPLLMERGLTESLAGRFELLQLPHWSYSEMRDAFGYSLDQYIFFGAYPGAARLSKRQDRWSRYIRDSLIETTIARDVLLLSRIDKPALMRRLFDLGCRYSGQILSYNKMIGQLQDAGNTTTLAHYLDLLSAAGMMTGLQKYAAADVRVRASSPKLQVLNSALMTATSGMKLSQAKADHEFWGRLVETAVGAHLVNSSYSGGYRVYYWRDRNREVDFVVETSTSLIAIEVKSNRRRDALPGMSAFKQTFHPTRMLLVGGDGISVEDFLSSPVQRWVN